MSHSSREVAPDPARGRRSVNNARSRSRHSRRKLENPFKLHQNANSSEGVCGWIICFLDRGLVLASPCFMALSYYSQLIDSELLWSGGMLVTAIGRVVP